MAQAPWVASLLVAMGAMCFSFMSLFAKMAQTQGHLSCFTLLAVRSALGLAINLFATFASWLRERRRGEATPALTTATTSTPGASKSSEASRASDEAVGGGKLFGLKSGAIVWLTVRALGGFGSVLLEYAALKVLPLKENTTIVYSSPAFIVLWAALLLRQPIKAVVVALLLVSFGGLVLEVEPWKVMGEESAPLWAYAASLAAAALAGLVYVSLRALAGTSCVTVLNAFLSTCLVLSVAIGVPLGEFRLPMADPREWGFLVAVGAFSYSAEVLMTCGFQRAGEATGQVSVLKFLAPIFSTLWGALLLGEKLNWADAASAVLILGSSAAIVLVQAGSHRAEKNSKVESPPAEKCGDHCAGDIEAQISNHDSQPAQDPIEDVETRSGSCLTWSSAETASEADGHAQEIRPSAV